MPKSNDKPIKVNLLTYKVSPVIFFIVDAILTIIFFIALDWLWQSFVDHQEFQFKIIGQIIFPIILAAVATFVLVNKAKKEK